MPREPGSWGERRRARTWRTRLYRLAAAPLFAPPRPSAPLSTPHPPLSPLQPFNSWGRVPYLFPWQNGTANGIKPYFDELAYNFIVAGGGANGGSFDHDDGSSFYNDHENFEVYGGHKSDFDGHAKRSFRNIHAYSNVYGSKCVGIMNLPHASPNNFFAEGYFENRCVLANAGDGYLDLGSPCSVDSTLANRMILGNNTVYAPNSSVSVSCGKTYSFTEWAATGADPGTTVADLPSAATIIGWARVTLGM